MQVNWKVNMVISALVTVGVYLLAESILDFKWWVDAMIGLFFGGIVNQLILRDKKEDHEIEVVPGLTKKELKDALVKGRDWNRQIHGLAGGLDKTHPRTAAALNDTADMVTHLFENFEKDPRDLTTTNARRLIHDHLPRALIFIQAYARLAAAGRLTDNEKQKLAAMEEKITTIRDSFSRHLEGFRNNDFNALQVEGETMETIYNLDI